MENQVNIAASQPDSQQSSVPAMPKYGIFQSLNHMMGAVKRNPVTFVATLVVSYSLSGIALFLTTLAATNLLLGQFGLLFASFSKILIVLAASLIIYTLLYALVYAFTVSCIAFSLSPERHSVGTVLKKALRSTIHVVAVNAWVAIVAYWPIAIAAFLPLFLLSGSRLGGNPSAALLAPVLIIAALIWAVIAQLRYALAPYIALFEPDVPVKQTLKRSEQLLKKGGQWFVFKGVLMIMAVFIFLAVVTGSNLRQLENSNDTTINIIFVIISILIEGAMVVLYFNRANKQDAATTPKAPMLIILVVAVLVGLLGLAAYNGKNGSEYGGSLSQQDQQAFTQRVNDSFSRVKIDNLANALEDYYNKNGFYPSSNELISPGWASKNLTYTVYKTSLPIKDTDLTDSNGYLINSANSENQYKSSPENCTKCASFELSAKLETSDIYKKASINNVVKPSATTQQQPTTSNNTQTTQR